MADHNDDLLDDDGLDPAFELDLADEEALLADDYEENPQSAFQESKRKIIERTLDDEDFIDLRVEEEIGEDVRHENSENGANVTFDDQNDSDDEVKERSRFKTERNITLTPSRSNKPIPETLDAVPVKTVGQFQSIRSRLGPQPQVNRRGGGRGGGPGHFRGRGRGGGFFHHPNNNFQNQQGFNNYQGSGGGHFPPPPPPQQNQYGGPPGYHMGGMPPQHNYYGGPPPGPPPQHHEPPHMPQEQQNMAPQHYQQMPPPHFQSYQAPHQQPPQQQIPHQPPPHQQPIQTQPYYENAPPQPKPNQPPARIHVNPHFKNNLGSVWNGITNSWTSQQGTAPQQTVDQYSSVQDEWTDNTSQDYYNPSSSQPTYNEYADNQYYGDSGQDQGYQHNNVAPQQYQHPPAVQPPVQQGNWENNHQSNYYPSSVHPANNQYNVPPDQPPMVGNALVNPPPTYGPPHGPPPNHMGPPHGPTPMGGPRGPPPFGGPHGHPGPRGPIRGQHPMRGRPPMMGPSPKMMRPPFQSNNVQNPPGNLRMGNNAIRPNYNQNHKMGSNLNVVPRFRQQNPTPVRTTMVNNKQQLRKETVSNIVPIKTLSTIPASAAAPPEDEDEETKAYRKKIEAQKKLREDLLRQKEERRKVAIQQKLQQQEDGVENTSAPSQSDNPETTYKTVRIMQSDGTTVLRKLTLAQIAKLKKITPGAQAAKQTPVKTETTTSKLVSIENLSASTSYRLLMDMARTVGVVETVNLDSDARKAFIRFMKPEDAQLFVRRHHRKMVDLSMIQATVVPESVQSTKRS